VDRSRQELAKLAAIGTGLVRATPVVRSVKMPAAAGTPLPPGSVRTAAADTCSPHVSARSGYPIVMNTSSMSPSNQSSLVGWAPMVTSAVLAMRPTASVSE
jgi:hypothetical protein